MNRPRHESSHEAGLAIRELLIVLFVIAVLAAVVSGITSTPDNFRTQSMCADNIHQLATAIQMYCADHGGTFPKAQSWNDDLLPYTKTSSAFFCPRVWSKSRPTYAINGAVSGINEKDVPKPDILISLFDSIPGKNLSGGPELLPAPPRHMNGENFAFADGHVKCHTRTSSSRELMWDVSK
ncbi:MAG TPA: hypothetical protein VGK34_07870 [Armatimonadota bacterium]